MLFSEIYGNYYRTVAHILSRAVKGTLDQKSLSRIVQEEAFGESLMTIPDALLSGRWGLLTEDFRTPLEKEPARPLTIPEKRWLKAILLDPRMQLFDPDMTGLEAVQPLFRQEWLSYYDRYTDGDPYTDPLYIQNFRCILTALRECRQLEVTFTGGTGVRHHVAVSPEYLEYSEKDDRFRLVGESYHPLIVNLSRIEKCCLLEEKAWFSDQYGNQTAAVTLELTDARNTLERFLLHFSHLQKETKRLDEKHYQVTLYYDRQDETEMLIRILSFGPMVRVTAPAALCEKLHHRIARQVQLINPINES